MYDEFDNGDWTSGFRSRRTWVRGFFMLVFLFVLWLARLLLTVMAVFQFGAHLIARRPVGRLLPFGRSLALYLQEIGLYLTYNAEEKPFPFAPWPESGPGEQENGEEGEAWEAYEPYPPPDAAYAPEPEEPATEPEPEPEPAPDAKPKPKSRTARRKKGGSRKAADTRESEESGDTEDTEDAAEVDEDDDTDGEDTDEPGGRAPPRPDA